MSVFTGGPYGRLAVMLNTLSSLNIEIIIIIIILLFNVNYCVLLYHLLNFCKATVWCVVIPADEHVFALGTSSPKGNDRSPESHYKSMGTF